jgi:hypothetical protein
MKQSNTATPGSYLAVVTDLQQIKVHCPICLQQALARSVMSAMAARNANMGAMAAMAAALHQLLIALELLTSSEIDAAHRLLLVTIQSEMGEHTDELPF